MKYLNMKTKYGVETIDQLDRKDFKTYEDFKNELIRLVNEYHMCGMPVYVSNKCDKTWKKGLKMNIQDVIKQLKHWRYVFLSDSQRKDYHHYEIEDLIDNITVGDHACYASYMFNQLSNNQKKKLISELVNIGIYLNIEDLICVYDLDCYNFKKGE